MSQPIRYLLRQPWFISSRLMPAVTIADATIHLQAVDVDRDDADDPRVVWEYLIDAPTVHHAGRDLTTPYRGPGTIDDQLPTAMGTLLGYLDHVADGDDPDGDPTVPDPVCRWARLHRHHIAAMAALVEPGPGQPPVGDPAPGRPHPFPSPHPGAAHPGRSVPGPPPPERPSSTSHPHR